MRRLKIEVKSSEVWSEVEWSEEVKSRSGGKARMKSSQEWSQEVKMNRRNEEAKNEWMKNWRSQEVKNEEVKKSRIKDE